MRFEIIFWGIFYLKTYVHQFLSLITFFENNTVPENYYLLLFWWLLSNATLTGNCLQTFCTEKLNIKTVHSINKKVCFQTYLFYRGANFPHQANFFCKYFTRYMFCKVISCCKVFKSLTFIQTCLVGQRYTTFIYSISVTYLYLPAHPYPCHQHSAASSDAVQTRVWWCNFQGVGAS